MTAQLTRQRAEILKSLQKLLREPQPEAKESAKVSDREFYPPLSKYLRA